MDFITPLRELWTAAVTHPTAIWLLSDPAGQRVGLGVAIAAVVVFAVVFAKFGKQLVKKFKHVPMLLLAAGGGFYALVMLLQLDPQQWAPAAALTAVSLLVLGLLAAVLHKNGSGGGKGQGGRKPKPA